MYKLKNNKLTNIIGGISCLSLLSLAFFAITPPVYDGVNAESTEIPISFTSEDYITLATTGS